MPSKHNKNAVLEFRLWRVKFLSEEGGGQYGGAQLGWAMMGVLVGQFNRFAYLVYVRLFQHNIQQRRRLT
jgi:hypothetical protein